MADTIENWAASLDETARGRGSAPGKLRLPELLRRIGAIADRPGDPSEELLRHRILIYAGMGMSGGGLLWGTLSAIFGLFRQSLVPYGYVVITALNLTVLAKSKNFPLARAVQLLISLLLPFAFQWALGGFGTSGNMMYWSMMALVGSLTFQRASTGVRWWVFYVVLTIASGFLESHLSVPEAIRSPGVSTVFFVLNMVVVSSVIFALILFFVVQRQRAIEELNVKNTQLATSQQALVQSEKMAALGQLVAGVAHELNTPLGAIRASVDNLANAAEGAIGELPRVLQSSSDSERAAVFSMLDCASSFAVPTTSREERQARRVLRKALEEQGVTGAAAAADLLVDMGLTAISDEMLPLLTSARSKELLNVAHSLVSLRRSAANIRLAAERSSKMVFALKSYAHPGADGASTRASLADNLDTVLMLYHNQIKRGVEVTRTYSGDTVVEGVHDQLNQVWTNLIHNALQAMDYRGALIVEAVDEGDSVRVSIKDDGPGISEDVQARVFEPFFTTKAVGEGSGLGLSICRDIVQKHQGAMSFETGPGCTVFRVRLPRVCPKSAEEVHSG